MRIDFPNEWATGQRLGKLLIDHRCHNHACVNPAHLRPTTPKQNIENRSGLNRNNSSGIRGVSWCGKDGRWHANVGHRGKMIWVGSFDTSEAAGEAVQLKRLELFTHNDLDRV